VSTMYHDSGVVGCRSHLWRRCNSRGGSQVAHSAALALQSLARLKSEASEEGRWRAVFATAALVDGRLASPVATSRNLADAPRSRFSGSRAPYCARARL